MANSKKQFSVYLVGGGSGGHVSPLKPIAQELVRAVGKENLHVTFVCEKGGAFSELMKIPEVQRHKQITAGKFRRYHGDSLLDHLKDVRTIALNLRDLLRFLVGCFQAFFMLIKQRPNVIFLKGGFVCVPVGWMARFLRIPYVTHDSDAVPGLANRLTAKGARKNLVALPEDNYPYPKHKTLQVGVPISPAYFNLDKYSKQEARIKLSIPEGSITVLITGGGLGAEKMNNSVIEALNKIANKDSSSGSIDSPMHITHITGKKLYDAALEKYESTSLDPKHVSVIDFTTDMLSYVAAADIVISRAGATSLAELAAAKRACIIVPGVHLAGGQQVHNANLIEKEQAAIILLEQDIDGLVSEIIRLATNKQTRTELGEKLSKFAVKDSARKIAILLCDIAGFDVELASNSPYNSSKDN